MVDAALFLSCNNLVRFGTQAHKDTGSTRLNAESSVKDSFFFLLLGLKNLMGRGWLRQELVVEEKNERKATPVKMELLKLWS